jgi:cation diffusion facilitator CzcD-associated flavoprotein CzcO
LEGYARFLELDVWTASTITKTSWNDSTKAWTVVVNHGGKGTRVLTVKHLVFATGSGGHPTVPDIPGKVCDAQLLHRSKYKHTVTGKLQRVYHVFIRV